MSRISLVHLIKCTKHPHFVLQVIITCMVSLSSCYCIQISQAMPTSTNVWERALTSDRDMSNKLPRVTGWRCQWFLCHSWYLWCLWQCTILWVALSHFVCI